MMSQWQDCRFTECPSFMEVEDGLFLLAALVCPIDKRHFFLVIYGFFENNKFSVCVSAEVDKGPDQYAGQVFRDHLGRNIIISWMPGWAYIGYVAKDIGCMSVPREPKLENGKITAYPVKELRHLLKDDDDAIEWTENGFIVRRDGRDPLVYNGKISDIKILRDVYILEIFLNGGEEVYSVLL